METPYVGVLQLYINMVAGNERQRLEFCKQEIESIEHLFFYHDVTKVFWEALCSWLSNYKIEGTINLLQ